MVHLPEVVGEMKGVLITVGNIASDLSEIGLSTCSFILALFELLDQFIELLGHTLFDNVVIKGLQHSTELCLNVAPQLSTGPANLCFGVHRRLWSRRLLYRHLRAGCGRLGALVLCRLTKWYAGGYGNGHAWCHRPGGAAPACVH
jgi:hypothetical protein